MLVVCCCRIAVTFNVSFASIMKSEVENARDVPLQDINDHSPEFLRSQYNTSVSEVGYSTC